MDPAYTAEIRALAEYAPAHGVELGGYALLASRRISDEHDVIDPETGAPGHATVRVGEGPEWRHALARDHGLTLELVLPPGMTWVELR